MVPGRKGDGTPVKPSASSGQAAGQLLSDLHQPLTAAKNYVGTARSMILSGDVSQSALAAALLGKAAAQILLAGQIAGQLHDCLEIEQSPS